ncbi:MAG: hypothetical protein WCO51_11915, partial [bacterium]
MRKYLFTVTGLCILMLIVTLMRPSTRGLFLLHLEMIFRTPVQFSAARMITGIEPESNLKDQPWGVAQKKRMKEAASKFPNDVPVQIALAVDAGEMASSGETLRLVQAYKKLAERYPQSPSAQAALIREMSRNAVRLKRNEENALIGYPPEPLPPPSKSEDLIAYDAAAARGERYDPKNAFFPFMRASCLFAANQDSEAIKCLKRAAEKPNWNDYSSDYINGSCRLAEITYGDKTTIRHIAAFIANPYPHFTNTRAVAWVATYKAVEAEARGNRAEGKAIRHALISCGDKMRANSNAIGTLVSEAIEVTSMTRPGGAPARKDIEKMKNQMRINNAHD